MEKISKMLATALAVAIVLGVANDAEAKKQRYDKSTAIAFIKTAIKNGHAVYPVYANNGTVAVARRHSQAFGSSRSDHSHGGWDIQPDCVLKGNAKSDKCRKRREMALAMFKCGVTVVRMGPGPAPERGGYWVQCKTDLYNDKTGETVTIVQKVMHCKPNALVKVGDIVWAGTPLCEIGDSAAGYSHTEAAHLHLEIGISATEKGNANPIAHIDPALIFTPMTGPPIPASSLPWGMKVAKHP